MYSVLIPQHLQEELIQIGEDITKYTFRIGDIVIAITDYAEANGLECSKRDIWRAVGAFIGKAANTVQGYEALSRFFSESIRRRYDILSASHFRVAMQIDSQTDYSWQNVLDYAMKKIDDYGRPASVDELRRIFIYQDLDFEYDDYPLNKVQQSNPLNDFLNRLGELKRTVELIQIPEEKRSELLEAVRIIERVLETMMEMA